MLIQLISFMLNFAGGPDATVNAFWQQEKPWCGAHDVSLLLGKDAVDPRGGGMADCEEMSTNPDAIYSPGDEPIYIRVVIHVIQHSDGSGSLDESRLLEQLEVLNNCYRAMPGSTGANGYDTGIEFVLATKTPGGAPTTGIKYHVNDTWFTDAADGLPEFAQTIGWDQDRYLNIYTCDLSPNYLGYAWQPYGSVGYWWDGVYLNYRNVGGPDSIPWAEYPYNAGDVAVHEVGHYLGLHHTFEDCDSGDCNSSGDTCCDTNTHSSPNWCCTSEGNCGTSDLIRNYMSHTSHAFTYIRTAHVVLEFILRTIFGTGCLNTICDVPCVGDVDGSDEVDVNDVLLVLSSFGDASPAGGDADEDGDVDVNDVLLVVSALGGCP